MTVHPEGQPQTRRRPRLPAPVLGELDASSVEPTDRKVYGAIRRALMAGAILPGTRLSSRSIASALGVSAMPVREALKRLDADGVLRGAAKRAFVVHDMTQSEYKEILSIRIRLEGLLACEAASCISDNELHRVMELQEAISRSQDWRQSLRHNFEMHFLIYSSARMPYALALVENIWLRVGPALHLIMESGATDVAYEHHPAILTALQRRDRAAAEAALRDDLLANARAILARLPR